MNVAKRFKFDLKDPDIGKLSINFVQTALFSLAEASVPQAAREEAVAIAKEGVKIDIKKAIELKAKHLTPKQESSDVVVRGKTDTQQLKDLTSRQEIIKVIPKKISKWDLGRHFLFQGDPNDAEFIKQLPHKIALNLAFPTTRNWNFKYPYQIDSTVLFSSIYQRDLEPDFFESTIVEVIKSTTDSNNVAAICYCPNIIIFQIAHDLGLRCFIAEPENVKCLKILEFFSRQKI